MKEILIKSSHDGTYQPLLFHYCGEKDRPLLVGLHTWSFDRYNQIENMLPYAQKHNWNLLLPEFRGPNLQSNPNCHLACGSDTAKQDIFDAIEYITQNYNIDTKNIYMLGLSGGGHMALLAATKNPKLFRAVGAFVPVTDLKDWYYNSGYSQHIAACLGGSPEEIPFEYEVRSPINHIDELANVNLKIFHGKEDNIVSVSQSIRLFNKIFESHPNARVYLDIFNGMHIINMETAFDWFLSQQSGKQFNIVTG